MKKLLIAVIEDDIDDRDFICSALNDKSNNVEIIAFPGGAEFFSFLKTNSTALPDLVITDLRMPLISGFEVIRKMKAGDTTKNTTVVVLSTSSNNEDIEKAKDLGAAGYFVKPYNLKGYEDIKFKIMESLKFDAFSFKNAVGRFLKTFQVLIPHPTI
jgi:DNA-binding response OmpR family regulator